MPFAARLAGIVGPDTFSFHAINQARYDGFPLAVEALQGWAWRLAGRPEAANLVGLGALVAYAFALRRAYGLPMRWTLLALLAVPLVLTHAVSSYVDLPANLAVAALLQIAAEGWGRTDASLRHDPKRAAGRVAVALLSAAFAGNAKLLLVPVASVGFALVVARVAWVERRARWAWVFVLGTAAIAATPLKNAWIHGNPAYPVELAWRGHDLPHTEAVDVSTPPSLRGVPGPARFVVSLAEYGLAPLEDPRRWTLDQYMPPDSPGHRMGGFFGAYVAFAVIFFAVTAHRHRHERATRARVAIFALATVLVAFAPQSHQLRYYLYWMITLLGFCSLEGASLRGAPTLARSAAFVAFGIVNASTRGAYLLPTGYDVRALVRDKTQPELLNELHPGDRACFYDEPWTFLYTPYFQHRGLWHLREGTSEEACAGDRFLGVR